MADAIITGRALMAEIIGVTTTGLVRMEQRGLPVLRKALRGREATAYHLPSVVKWIKEDQARQLLLSNSGDTITELSRRRARAEARRAEIEVAKLEGSVADLELVRRGLEGLIINQRTILLSTPAVIGREIDEPELRARVVAIVDRRIRDALEAMASYDPVIAPSDSPLGTGDDADQDESAAYSAAAETHDQPVGRAKTLSEPRRRRLRQMVKRDRAIPDGPHGRGV